MKKVILVLICLVFGFGAAAQAGDQKVLYATIRIVGQLQDADKDVCGYGKDFADGVKEIKKKGWMIDSITPIICSVKCEKTGKMVEITKELLLVVRKNQMGDTTKKGKEKDI